MDRRAASRALIVLCLGARFTITAQAEAATTPAVALPATTAAQVALAVIEDDPAPLLGLDLGMAIARLGAPSSVYPLRGEEAWQDDVAFVYSPGYSLFWFGDRVWQLRFSAPYAGSIYGLFIGDAAEKVYSTLGSPYERAGDSLVYRMPYRGYPVRLRLVLSGEKVADAYLYRADF